MGAEYPGRVKVSLADRDRRFVVCAEVGGRISPDNPGLYSGTQVPVNRLLGYLFQKAGLSLVLNMQANKEWKKEGRRSSEKGSLVRGQGAWFEELGGLMKSYHM